MIGFITGLASEADCLAPPDGRVAVRVAGIGPGNAERCARELIADRCTSLVSFGLAGGLASDLKPGAVVIADSIVAPDGYAYPTDAKLTARLLGALPNAVRRPVMGSASIIASPAQKADLHRRTKAAAVDMESHQIVKVAHQAGLGFVAVRAIADPFNASLPEAALQAVGTDGKPDIAHVVTRLILRPWDLPALVRLAAYSRRAHESLRRVAPIIVRCTEGGF